MSMKLASSRQKNLPFYSKNIGNFKHYAPRHKQTSTHICLCRTHTHTRTSAGMSVTVHVGNSEKTRREGTVFPLRKDKIYIPSRKWSRLIRKAGLLKSY